MDNVSNLDCCDGLLTTKLHLDQQFQCLVCMVFYSNIRLSLSKISCVFVDMLFFACLSIICTSLTKIDDMAIVAF